MNTHQHSEEVPIETDRLVDLLTRKVVGQESALKFIVPCVHMYQAGLAPEGRPAGVFLLLGPTGTGKTRTVEAIAEVLHGSARNVLKMDCGEFQMEHEVAKLIGAPPGYLGHRETPPMLSQQQLTAVTSKNCDLSLVLFDEIEKAAPSLTRMLLGILDKATLRLGDNTTVDFEKSLVFFTSNLGAREMMKEINPEIGFQAAVPKNRTELAEKLESIGLTAVRKRFSPEFVNRIDAVVTYRPLDQQSLDVILDQHIDELQHHVNTRLGPRCFDLSVSPESRKFLLEQGTSAEYGARELKRTIHRNLTQPLATMVASGRIEPGATVKVELSEDRQKLCLFSTSAQPARQHRPTVLIVDDNEDLLAFLERLLGQAGWQVATAASAEGARRAFSSQMPAVMLLDYMLGREDGLALGLELQLTSRLSQLIVMTGGELSSEEEMVCRKRNIPILRKPFLANDLLNLICPLLIPQPGANSNVAGVK